MIKKSDKIQLSYIVHLKTGLVGLVVDVGIVYYND